MAEDKLSELQWRILRVLADLDPPWVLTGGGALAGFHLKHRRTRDLDLFWRQRGQLGELPRFVADRLRSEGMTVEDLQRTTSFWSTFRDGWWTDCWSWRDHRSERWPGRHDIDLEGRLDDGRSDPLALESPVLAHRCPQLESEWKTGNRKPATGNDQCSEEIDEGR